MKRLNLHAVAIDELVARFAALGVAQDKAELYGEISKYNRLFEEMAAVTGELRSRGREARLSLVQLYHHPNTQVRLQAAIETLAVARQEALQVIENISRSACYPQAGDAGMVLWRIQTGAFDPD